MGDFWTHDALDGLSVSLLFAHWLLLLLLFATLPPGILPSVTVRMYCPHGFKSRVSSGSAEGCRPLAGRGVSPLVPLFPGVGRGRKELLKSPGYDPHAPKAI